MSTLSSTFFLKEPKSDRETLILFSCYFKHEEKKFVYSTGEKIQPKAWDFKNRQPKLHGSNRSKYAKTIQSQINRYSDKFAEVQDMCKRSGEEDFTSKILRDEFDKEFKKSKTGRNLFFSAYDEFMDHKTKLGDWSPNTVKRYQNIRNLLEDFETDKKYKLTFNAINTKFHAEFTDYCLTTKGHVNNTYSRNLGLFKTFMAWAVSQHYTFNEAYKDFKKMKRVITRKVALNLEQLMKVWNMDLKNKTLECARDVFIFQSMIGCRYGDLAQIREENVYDGYFVLKEKKDTTKVAREIPLNETAEAILRKYDFCLPLISSQKQNAYIKKVCKKAGLIQETEEIMTRRNEDVITRGPLYKFVSTHVARRSAVTTMKRAGMPDKAIMAITGHKDSKTFNQYYIVDDEDKKVAVSAISLGREPLRKVD